MRKEKEEEKREMASHFVQTCGKKKEKDHNE